jgi:amino acid adenylation domain-containing protein
VTREYGSVAERLAALSKDKARLLTFLVEQRSQREPAIRSYPRDFRTPCRLPASGAQQRLWFIDQLEGGSIAYHIPLLLHIAGELDRQALLDALDALIVRHEALRTIFPEVDGVAMQEIVPASRFQMSVVDLSARPAAERDMEVLRHTSQELASPFDLASGPLVRGRLLQLSAVEHALLITVHHIVADGWSVDVFIRELVQLYAASHTGVPSPLPPLPIQYADYAQWQHERLTEADVVERLKYWRQHLQGAPELLELPSDRARPAVQTYRGSSVRVSLGAELTAELKALARRHDLTLAMVLYAGWVVLLARLSGQSDIVVGVPVANRPCTEVEGLIGFFVNTLAVRTRLENDPTISEILRQVKRSMVGAYSQQQVPFELVVNALQPTRTLSYSPIFQVMFALQPAKQSATQLAGITLVEREVPPQMSHFDLTLSLHEGGDEIEGTLTYATDLFDGDTVVRWAERLKVVLRAMVRDSEQRASALPLMDDHERHQILETFNGARVPAPDAALIHQQFERKVECSPAAAAIVYDGRSLTYDQLNRRANQLARHLRELGVRPGDRVALCVERSLELVVALLAILKAGGAYVPLDPVHPDERLGHMLRDSRPVAVITRTLLASRLEIAPGCAGVVLDAAPWDGSAWASYGTDNLDAAAMGLTAADLAYVIYTSGSTGVPKGVMVEHASVLNFLQGLERSIHGVTPDCRRIAWNSSIGFDMAVKAWGQLVMGRTVYLLAESVRLNPDALLDFLEQNEIEAIECTPSHLRSMCEAGFLQGRARCLRKVLLGGEAIDARIWTSLAVAEQTAFFNMYGPTECSVDASCGRIAGPTPHIGRVMANARVYVLDAHREPVPVGVVGEIHIGGMGVARGYLDRPELTADRFLPDPFVTTPGSVMYRTGDLARWRSDGALEYIGRNDFQVKIRGFRIELGEIEAQLLRHPHVKDAVIVVREDAENEKRLVAYLTQQESTLAAEELRAYLKSRLPEYMVPSAFVVLDQLPLNANGKLDRKALPPPELGAFASRHYEAPRGDVETIVAGVWQALLRVERVGRRDNFFELGGHSLLVVQMMGRLRRLGLCADVRRVFESQTLADLSATLTPTAENPIDVPPNLIRQGCTAITPDMLPLVKLNELQIEQIVRTVPGGVANIQDIYPLAPLQEGILFHHLLNDQSGDVYVAAVLLAVSSRQRLDELIAGLQEAIVRHDMLRTSLSWERLPRPVQVVHHHASLQVTEVTLDPERDSLEQAQAWLQPERQRVDLRRAPMMQLQTAADPHSTSWYVLLQMHHIIGDNTSQKVVFSDVIGRLRGCATLPAVVPYRNHVAQALARIASSDAEAFFRGKLADVDEPTAPFGILDVYRDGTRTREARDSLDSSISSAVRIQARRLGVSAATLFHAACSLVTAHCSGRDDVVFGTVLLGRLHGDAGAQRTMGMFINTLPLRVRIEGRTAEELVQETQRELQELLIREQSSLALAQRCSGIAGSAPLFTLLLNYRHGRSDGELDWEAASGIRVLARYNRTNYPITLSVDDVGNGFELSVQCDAAISPHRVIAYTKQALQSLVQSLQKSPQSPAVGLTIVPDDERCELIERLNSTATAYSRKKLVHHLFEEQAARTPQAIAVEHGSQSLSYRDLNVRANQLAHELRRKGVGPDVLVGICAERGFEMIIGVLAILKAGGAYLPLDPSYPRERLEYMLEDAKPHLVLTQSGLHSLVPSSHSEVLVLDATLRGALPDDAENPSVAMSAETSEHLLYVIYTSGSTGRPKGTGMPHRSMVNLIEWHRSALSSDRPLRVLQFAALSFDVAFQEIFSTLSHGGTLVLLDEWMRRDVRALTDLLSSRHIERLFVPPMMLLNLAEYFQVTQECPATLRDVIVAGEQLRISDELVALFKRLARCRLHNHYGPTETHVVTALTLPPDPDQWPMLPTIGKPIANARIYILDARLQPVPLGVAGEIYIGGDCVARGYVNCPALTAARFVPDPFAGNPARMYKTGDVGRWCSDGTVQYLGRNDDQVKIRGFRIELGEIEAQLARHAHVKEATVIAHSGVSGDKSLVAYVTPRAEIRPRIEDMRTHLASTLPEYMIPAAFVVLTSMPLTPSGKLNRRALPAPAADSFHERPFEAPQGDVENALAQIWCELLRVPRIGRHDNFFELGGHSLHGMRLVVQLEVRFEVRLPVVALFRHPSLEALAKVIESLSCSRTQAAGPHSADYEEGTIDDLRVHLTEGTRTFAEQR